MLQQNNINTQPAVLAQSHTAIIRALYIQGVCDFGATFAISGDPRTASAIQGDLTDVMNRVIVIWRSEAVIPNVSLSFLAGLSEGDRQLPPFLVARADDGKALLNLSANGYQIEDIKRLTIPFDPLRDAAG